MGQRIQPKSGADFQMSDTGLNRRGRGVAEGWRCDDKDMKEADEDNRAQARHEAITAYAAEVSGTGLDHLMNTNLA
jgi:hypothetical protein